ncbi:MAG: N-acetylmuramoyl-L-alanine amidase [Oscillospiraceae bacterium]|jgi:N-acetylmuramoyl-L-alanine amidase|nr:N-acetylmuramoyl-L-alanine amidase [Oscillospiraceae bacterium]
MDEHGQADAVGFSLKRKKLRLCIVLAFGAVLIAAGLCVAFGVQKWIFDTKAEPDRHIAATTAPVATEEATVTTPQVAAVDWRPQPRDHARKSALLVNPTQAKAEQAIGLGFDSLLLDFSFTDYNTAQLEQAKTLLDDLGARKLYRAVRLDAAADAGVLATGLGKLLRMTSLDAVVLSVDFASETALARFKTDLAALASVLRQAELELPVLVEVGDPIFSAAAQEIAVLVAAAPQGELLLRAAGDAGKSVLAWKAMLPGGAKTPVGVLADMKTALGKGGASEAAMLLTALEKNEADSVVLANVDFAPQDVAAAALLKSYYAGELAVEALTRKLSFRKPFTEMKQQQVLESKEPEISFSGGSSPLFPLLLNGKEIKRNESGDFSIECALQAGENSFTFEHQGQKYTVRVTYAVQVLQKVRPNSVVETTGDVDFAIRAVALRGAAVKAVLGKDVITLKPGAAQPQEEGATHEEDSAFITYEGVFRLPTSGASRKSLGYVEVTATYAGITNTKSGAKIILLPRTEDAAEAEPPKTTASHSSTASPAGTAAGETDEKTTSGETDATTENSVKELLTPYEYNGESGKFRMIEVTEDYANTRSNSVLNEDSIPRSSPLLKGTFDFVVGEDTIEGTTHYHLKSGKRIEDAFVKVIKSGYNLPLNRIRATSSSKDGALELRFRVDWKIPFNVDLIGQGYESSNGYAYGVSSYTATGLELVFYHTGSYSDGLKLGSGTVVGGADWSASSSKNTVTLKLEFRKAARFYGYHAAYDGNELVITLRAKPPGKLDGAVIVLDPGHGGGEVGSDLSVSHATLKYEKQVNLVLAKKIKALLEEEGATVYLTRTGDSALSLQERAAYLRKKNPDMFISIHCDSYSKSSVMGTSAFYYRPYSYPLADAIHRRLVSTYKDKIYTNSNYDNAADLREKVDRGTKFYPFAVTRVEECPAVLIEYGFGSNMTECRVLQRDSYQNRLAEATVAGIEDYLKAAQ